MNGTGKHWYESSTIWGVLGQVASSSGLLWIALSFLLEIPINPEVKAALLGAFSTGSFSSAALAINGRMRAKEPIGKLPTPVGSPPPDNPEPQAIEPLQAVQTAPAFAGEPDLDFVRTLPSAESPGGQLSIDLASLTGKYRFVALHDTKLKAQPSGGQFVSIAKGTAFWVERCQYFNEDNGHLRVKLSTVAHDGLFCVFEEHWRIENADGIAEGVSRPTPAQPWF